MPSAEPKGKGEYGDCLGCDEDPSPLMSMMRSTELLTEKNDPTTLFFYPVEL